MDYLLDTYCSMAKISKYLAENLSQSKVGICANQKDKIPCSEILSLTHVKQIPDLGSFLKAAIFY